MVEWSLGNKILRFLLINLTEIRFFNHLNYVEVNLKLQFLIKSGYHIVPNPSIALIMNMKDNYTAEDVQKLPSLKEVFDAKLYIYGSNFSET